MKSLTIFVGFCLILWSSPVTGGLLKDITASIHDGAQKVRSDIRDALHFNHKNSNNEVTTVKSSAASDKPENKEDINTSQTAIVFPDMDNKETPSASSGQPDVVVSSTTMASTTNTTEKKDGRENFAGGCATGFLRTADGRCLPTI